SSGAGGEAGAAGASGYAGMAGTAGASGGIGGIAGSGGEAGAPLCEQGTACIVSDRLEIIDPEFADVYYEDQNAWTVSAEAFDSVVIARDFEAYNITFSGPVGFKTTGIKVCYTEVNGDYTACKPDNMRYATETHGLSIRIFGQNWTIIELNPASGVLTNEYQMIAGGSVKLTRVFDTIELVDGQSLPTNPEYMVTIAWTNNDTRDTKPDSLKGIFIYKPVCSHLEGQTC
ncbi:hypothetical protein JXA56_00435, partial [Candidatus Micrarchaeota archaeon]|nr:hypothetical protein [Candidatus Micrarchaeota archaeon]